MKKKKIQISRFPKDGRLGGRSLSLVVVLSGWGATGGVSLWQAAESVTEGNCIAGIITRNCLPHRSPQHISATDNAGIWPCNTNLSYTSTDLTLSLPYCCLFTLLFICFLSSCLFFFLDFIDFNSYPRYFSLFLFCCFLDNSLHLLISCFIFSKTILLLSGFATLSFSFSLSLSVAYLFQFF